MATPVQSPPKRAKVILACQRCKKRKQKCDGTHPCGKCQAHNLHCEYVIPQKPMPFGKNHYIDSLERRVAELETLLASHGIEDLSNDHLRHCGPNLNSVTQVDAEQGLPGANKSDSDVSDTLDHDILEWQDGIDPVVSVLRSLSLDVNGSGYIGASSHVALGRLFSFLKSGRTNVEPDSTQRSVRGSLTRHISPSIIEQPIDLTEVPADVADRLFTGYLKHIATRFPIIHSVWARKLHLRRSCLTDIFDRSALHLVYAAAGRFLVTAGESGDFASRRHYEAAIQSLDTVLAYNDVRTVQTLMLMAIYCLRDPVGAGAWTYSRTALLIAIDHGLHRQTKGMSHISLENELRKRLFWACYCFDRQISIPIGRPFGISDRDVDLEIPLDMNEDCTKEHLASFVASPSTSSKSTTMTSFIRMIELRKIESDIQQTIYRVDRTAPVENSVIDRFLKRLTKWKDRIPQDSKRFRDAVGVPFDGYDYYLVFYYKCLRLLLYPSIMRREVELQYLKECAQACAGVCGAYKRLHQSLAVGYSSMALQTVFMAGLTLVYCIWLSPDVIFDMTTSNGVHDCSVVLFVIAERVSAAKRYRNAFEAIRQRVIDHIAEVPRPRFRETIPGLTAGLAPSETPHDDVVLDEGSYEQLSQILADMAGEEWSTAMDGPLFQQNVGFDGVLDVSEM